MTHRFQVGARAARASSVQRSRPGIGWIGLGSLISLLVAGCDSGGFVPPRPTELGGASLVPGSVTGTPAATTGGSAPAGAKAIELILGPRDPQVAEMLKGAARAQAGQEMVRIQVAATGENDDPTTQADLIRKAIARNPLALVVEPGDASDPELARAISDANGRGLNVVLVGHPLAAATGGQEKGAKNEKAEAASHDASSTSAGAAAAGSRGGAKGRLILVVPESFAKTARSIVQASIKNALNAKLVPAGGVFILVDSTSDPLVEDRVQAFHDALRSSGITAVEEVRFSADTAKGKAKLLERVKANLNPSIVLGADFQSFVSAYQVANDLLSERPLIVAGYSSDESNARLTQAGEFAALAIYSQDRLIRKAVSTAALSVAGQRLPDRVEMTTPLYFSPDNATTPKMQASMNAMKSRREQMSKQYEEQLKKR